MKQRLALRVLAELMQWSDEVAAAEFGWLRLVTRMKYDAYEGYLAGVRFIESLVAWLQQFDASDRAVAYALVRRQLVFISAAELRRLIERCYPREIEPRLVSAAAIESKIEPYRVWATEAAAHGVGRLRRKILFMGLSDGARMDVFRRANTGVISNEQTVLAPLVDHEKWEDLGTKLAEDPLCSGERNPQFTRLFLIDDLTASGTTLIRSNEEKNEWKGKLPKLHRTLTRAREELGDAFPLAPGFAVHVHHYVATQHALDAARENDARARTGLGADAWFPEIEFSAGLILPEAVKLGPDDPFRKLADRYYDPSIEDRHSAESGVKDMRYGYKECALPLILEHNTPNNALPLLWAETGGANDAHAMRPLFRRRTRHV